MFIQFLFLQAVFAMMGEGDRNDESDWQDNDNPFFNVILCRM